MSKLVKVELIYLIELDVDETDSEDLIIEAAVEEAESSYPDSIEVTYDA